MGEKCRLTVGQVEQRPGFGHLVRGLAEQDSGLRVSEEPRSDHPCAEHGAEKSEIAAIILSIYVILHIMKVDILICN